jgi:mono/diheme cytochrome c family protein
MKKITLITALLSSGFLYIIAQTQKPTKKTIDTPAASIERGQAVYQKECLSCHQADGGGVPHMNPPLVGSTNVLKDKKKIIGIVLNGMTDRIPLDDEYYSNNMASHSYLTNQQIADVLNYIRNSFGNKADIITAGEVKTVRTPKKSK